MKTINKLFVTLFICLAILVNSVPVSADLIEDDGWVQREEPVSEPCDEEIKEVAQSEVVVSVPETGTVKGVYTEIGNSTSGATCSVMGTKCDLPNGLYVIKDMGGKAWDVENYGTSIFSNLQVYDFNRDNNYPIQCNQEIRSTNLGDGFHRLSFDYCGKAVGVDTAWLFLNNIRLCFANDSSTQKWLVLKNPDGTYSFMLDPEITGNTYYAISVDNPGINNSNLSLKAWTGKETQKFNIIRLDNNYDTHIDKNTCQTVFRTGNAVSIMDWISAIKVDNYSYNYSKEFIGFTNLAYAKDPVKYMDGYNIMYRFDSVGAYIVTIKVHDNWGACPDYYEQVKIAAYPNSKEEALNVMCERLDGTYMTLSGKYCSNGGTHYSCKQCKDRNVLTAAHLASIFPEVTFDLGLYQRDKNSTCNTCMAGTEIMCYIEAQLLSGTPVKVKKDPHYIVKTCYTKEEVYDFIVQNAEPGDNIRANTSSGGHSMVYLGDAGKNTIKVIDSNARIYRGKIRDKNNRVAVYSKNLSNYAGRTIKIIKYSY